MRLFGLEITRKRASDAYLQRDKGLVRRWSSPPTKNAREWLDMFGRSPRLAVVDRIASDLSSVKGRLYRVAADGTEEELEDHPFVRLMRKPNPLYEMTAAALWRLFEVYLLINGEAYLLIEKDALGRPAELWPVPPNWVTETPYVGCPFYVVQSSQGQTIRVSVDDMFVMRRLNPLDPFARGLGEAQSIADEVEIDEYAAKFQKRFFYNDASPNTIIKMPSGATPDQQERFKAQWNKKHRGVENSHRTAVVTGDFDIQVIGNDNARELAFNETRESMRNATLEHFGMPKEIMGITENSNRATADSAQYIYAKNTLTSRLDARCDAINEQLVPKFGSGLVWRYDEIIPYDQEFDKAVALDGWDHGLITQNQALEKLGFPTVENGDVYKVTLNDVFVPADADRSKVLSQLYSMPVHDGYQEEPRTSIEGQLAKGIQEQREAKTKQDTAYQQWCEEIELGNCLPAMEKAVQAHFDEEAEEILKAMGDGEKGIFSDMLNALRGFLRGDGSVDRDKWDALTDDEKDEVSYKATGKLIDWDRSAQRLQDRIMPLWDKARIAGAEIVDKVYGKRTDQPIKVVTWESRKKIAQKVTGIEDTTRKRIAKAVRKGIEKGRSHEDIRQAIMEDASLSEGRADLIARNEVNFAIRYGEHERAVQGGARLKTWVHNGRCKKPREHHREMGRSHETVPIHEQFSNGLEVPGDGPPEETVNCCCSLHYTY